MITLQQVRVTYGKTVALHGLELELEAGVCGLFGPNGSGKSTLLRVLAGLLRPANGRALLDGIEIRSGDEATRRRIGYSGHDSGLYGRLTVIENLRLFASLYDVNHSRCPDLLEQVGLSDRAATPVAELSAGLKRRASVARALLHSPDILLLDEPYANLDDDAADLISAAVMRWRGSGRLALIATHGAKRVKGWADASIILQRGAVVSYRRRTAEHAGQP